MRTQTTYSTNPRCLETYHAFDSEGKRIVTIVKSRCDDAKIETFYLYDGMKKILARRVEVRGNRRMDIYYPILTGGKTEISETYYRNGKPVFSCLCDSKGQPLPAYELV